ncbi:hypothetical protein [Achromobacter sp. DH1f]|uniref:hypothetical protein n=1 Tax=Achromobacter sp. DH1f TaxID=1397275 RepID=UPI00046AAF24|nr:hypothetical protein [Achromobacter sp. DH1f]
MCKVQSDRNPGFARLFVGVTFIVSTSLCWAQAQVNPSAVAAEKSALKNTKGQVADLLDLDAKIAADKMRREAGQPTQAELARQSEAAREQTKAAQMIANAPPPPPAAPQVEAIYGVAAQLTAVVSYNGQQYEFRAGRPYAVGHSGGPRLKSISGQCVSVTFQDGAKTACYRHEPNLGPGATPSDFNRGGTAPSRQDSTAALPGQFGVIAPPPPFLTK